MDGCKHGIVQYTKKCWECEIDALRTRLAAAEKVVDVARRLCKHETIREELLEALAEYDKEHKDA